METSQQTDNKHKKFSAIIKFITKLKPLILIIFYLAASIPCSHLIAILIAILTQTEIEKVLPASGIIWFIMLFYGILKIFLYCAKDEIDNLFNNMNKQKKRIDVITY